MIVPSDFKSDANREEILPMDAEGFPHVCIDLALDQYVGRCIPWHWHSAFEIDYVVRGTAELVTPDETFPLRSGEAIFLNSNVLHEVRAKDQQQGCKIYTHLFEMHFLSGMYNSVFERNYFLSVLKSARMQAFVIRPDHYRGIQMAEKILNGVELCRREPFGYEFELRAELCRFWCLLLEETESLRAEPEVQSHVDTDRIKLMLAYIHGHYMGRVTLESIAAAANISPRECGRCFQRCIKLSPIRYLTTYRVRMAAQMLLQTGDSILTIGENCGFSSSSYFGRVFCEEMGCTPKEYRRGKQPS